LLKLDSRKPCKFVKLTSFRQTGGSPGWIQAEVEKPLPVFGRCLFSATPGPGAVLSAICTRSLGRLGREVDSVIAIEFLRKYLIKNDFDRAAVL